MFEVGKKYKYMANQVVYSCIAADKTWAVLQFGEATPFVTQATRLYEEYKEPRTVTRWVNVYDNGEELYIFPSPRLAESKEQAQDDIVDADNLTWLATIPVSYTEPR